MAGTFELDLGSDRSNRQLPRLVGEERHGPDSTPAAGSVSWCGPAAKLHRAILPVAGCSQDRAADCWMRAHSSRFRTAPRTPLPICRHETGTQSAPVRSRRQEMRPRR